MGRLWWLGFLSVARADPPPEGMDLEDIDRWESRAFDLARGPAGCWDLRAELETKLLFYAPATLLSRPAPQERRWEGTIEGRLRDGTWEVIRYDLVDDRGQKVTDEASFALLVGKAAPEVYQNVNPPPPAPPKEEEEGGGFSISIGDEEEDAGEQSGNLLVDSVHGWWSSSLTTSYARWNAAEQGVELIIEVPVEDDARAEVVTATAFFPGGGVQPTRIDSVLPERLTIGEGLVRGRVIRGQLHLRGRQIDGLVLPTRESASAVMGILGYTVGFEQNVRYTSARACP